MWFGEKERIDLLRNIIRTSSCFDEILEFDPYGINKYDFEAINDILDDFIGNNSTISTTCPPSTTAITNGYSATTILPAERCGIVTSTGVASQTQPASKAGISTGQDKKMMISSLVEYSAQDVFSPYDSYVKSLTPIWIDQLGLVSAQCFNYPSFGHSAIGVKTMYGCTAVIIASEKGVYLSHIWESPVFVDEAFNTTDDRFFTITAFNSLRDGTIYAQSVTDLIGTDHNPGILNAIYAPKVFVLTPFTTDWDRRNCGISTTLRYQKRAEELAQKIAGIVPGSGGNGIILGYTRTSRQASSQEPGIAGRAILEIDPVYTRITTPYDPKSAGLQIGRWRLWVEDQLITYQDFWLPDITAPGTLPDGTLANETLVAPASTRAACYS
ncbi:uncharacterized protein PGRI_059410 [Penicillium griseofulvum]|uniref:Uncharacterized protein n=1 Tax=Penicillium patulum TaxID=5078 RepID=A0A135LLZ2_PENPA|nr:uncharacterized protein PGRI_059410 [Penicillium griseofulvum]KXG49973.1 hypothetical protein PGRI_059410 [Penicillium griseofulvum]